MNIKTEHSSNDSQEDITTANALKSLRTVIRWTEYNQNHVDSSTILALNHLENAMIQLGIHKIRKQTKITSFFGTKKL